LVNKLLSFKICPICAGVFLTWIWLLIGMKLNLLLTTNYQLLTAILMGGTVVGSTFKLEQFIKPKFILIWKTIFVILGFLAVYGLLSSAWIVFIIALVLAVLTTLVFKIKKGSEKKPESEQTRILEEKMKNCC